MINKKKSKTVKKIKVFIFARKNSVEIKNKNIKKINQMPLIHYSLKVANQVVSKKNIYVSSDSFAIKKIANTYGVNFIKRPKKLASSTSSEFLSWKHAVLNLYQKKIKFDIFVSLPATSPLRSKIDVLKTINKKNKQNYILLTASKSCRNPYFNIVEKKSNGFYDTVAKKKNVVRRQSAPKTFDLNTVAFVTTPEYIIKSKAIFEGRVAINLIPIERSLDIDSSFDLKIAKLLMHK